MEAKTSAVQKRGMSRAVRERVECRGEGTSGEILDSARGKSAKNLKQIPKTRIQFGVLPLEFFWRLEVWRLGFPEQMVSF
jgi:hypothetical protein